MPIGIGRAGLPDYRQKAMQGMSQAASTAGMMTPEIDQKTPGPSIGGGVMAGAGGALVAGQMGSALTAGGAAKAGAAVGGPWGLAVGAGIGALAHFLS